MPSTSLQPTPTFAPGEPIINLEKILLHGIGIGGDNVNPTSGGNKTPLHLDRNVQVILEGANQQPITSRGIIHYNPFSNGGTGELGGNIGIAAPAGSYVLKVKPATYLQKQVPGIITINGNITPPKNNYVTIISPIAFTTGDVNNDNQLDLLDYNIIISCFGSKQTTSSCITPPDTNSSGADLDDNGTVDGTDYNLFLRELSI